LLKIELSFYFLAVTTKKLDDYYVPYTIQHSLQFGFSKTLSFFSINAIFWCFSQSCAEEDRSAQASAPHGQMQRLCAYSAHAERSPPGAQRRCGVHIRGIVLYYVFTLWIHAVATLLNLGQVHRPNAISINIHFLLFKKNPFVCVGTLLRIRDPVVFGLDPGSKIYKYL
jgi:hypothetical protein